MPIFSYCSYGSVRILKKNFNIRHSSQGLIKGMSCITNLISFYDQVTHQVDLVFLDFRKAFDTVPYKCPAVG